MALIRCARAHAAVELAIKALIIVHDKGYPDTHNIGLLLERAEQVGETIGDETKQASRLTAYAGRQPSGAPATSPTAGQQRERRGDRNRQQDRGVGERPSTGVAAGNHWNGEPSHTQARSASTSKTGRSLKGTGRGIRRPASAWLAGWSNTEMRMNRSLGEVDGGDVAGLEEAEGRRELRSEGGHALAAGGAGRVGGTTAADEDDAGGESICHHADQTGCIFGSHRPSASNRESRADHGVQERLPCRRRAALGHPRRIPLRQRCAGRAPSPRSPSRRTSSGRQAGAE